MSQSWYNYGWDWFNCSLTAWSLVFLLLCVASILNTCLIYFDWQIHNENNSYFEGGMSNWCYVQKKKPQVLAEWKRKNICCSQWFFFCLEQGKPCETWHLVFRIFKLKLLPIIFCISSFLYCVEINGWRALPSTYNTETDMLYKSQIFASW